MSFRPFTESVWQLQISRNGQCLSALCLKMSGNHQCLYGQCLNWLCLAPESVWQQKVSFWFITDFDTQRKMDCNGKCRRDEYQSFLLSYRLFLRGNILFLYWRIFYLIFSGNQNRRETMTSFHFDQSLNRLFSEFIHIFSTYFCKHFFCVFFHYISNIYCQLLPFSYACKHYEEYECH